MGKSMSEQYELEKRREEAEKRNAPTRRKSMPVVRQWSLVEIQAYRTNRIPVRVIPKQQTVDETRQRKTSAPLGMYMDGTNWLRERKSSDPLHTNYGNRTQIGSAPKLTRERVLKHEMRTQTS